VTLSGDADLKAALDAFKPLMAGETLADRIEWTASPDASAVVIDAGEKAWRATVRKA